MAVGDAAVGAGYPILTGSERANTIDTEINRTRDIIAQLKAWVQSKFDSLNLTWTAITGKPSTFPPSGHTHDVGQVTNGNNALSSRMWFNDVDTAIRSQGDTAQLWVRQDGTIWTGQPILSPHAYNNPVTIGTYYALYVQPDGRIGRTPSAAKYKHDVHDYDGSVLGLRPVLYVLNDDPDETVRLGVIADDADEHEPLLVQRNGDEIEGFSYELLAVALLRDVQRLNARVAQLEAGE